MNRRFMGWAACAAAFLALTGCGHAPAPPAAAPAPALGLRCANASEVWAGDPHPARVEVENRTDKEMRIIIDRCLHHTLLGTVGPGRKAYLPLPRRLVRFGDGLRLHAYTQEPNQWYGSFRSDLAVPLAHVTISPETALVDVAQPDARGPMEGGAGDQRGRDPRGSVVSRVTEGLAFTSVFSFDSYSVLTWMCTAERVGLSFASGGRLDGDPHVTLSLGGEQLDAGTWSLIRAATDGAAAPADVVDRFTDRIRRAHAVTLIVDDGSAGGRGDSRSYQFNTRELDDALAELPCLRR